MAITVFQEAVTADGVKAKARELGANLVGIADSAEINANPPDPADPRIPADISDYDADRVIVLAKRLSAGVTRIPRWDERHKYYNDELTMTALEETALELVLWLESKGWPALIVPPTHVDPWRYRGDPDEPMKPLLSLDHCAVEAGLGTLGLNLQLLTPEYGPRVMLAGVLCSVPVECDSRMETALCRGPECGRCLRTCPGDVVRSLEPGLGGLRQVPRAPRLPPSDRFHGQDAGGRTGAAEGHAALGRHLQPVAVHFARRRRDHRLPALPGCLPGRRRLRAHDRRFAGRHARGQRRETGPARRIRPSRGGRRDAGRPRNAETLDRPFRMTLALPTSQADIDAVQRERLRAAAEAALTAPFHRKRLPSDLDLDRVHEPEEWRRIPILDKDELRALSPREFMADFNIAPRPDIQEYWRSGGSTGKPLFYPRTFRDMEFMFEGFRRGIQLAGVKPGDTAHISYPLGIHPVGHVSARVCQQMGVGVNWAGSGAQHTVRGPGRTDRSDAADGLDGHVGLRAPSGEPGRGEGLRPEEILGEEGSVRG